MLLQTWYFHFEQVYLHKGFRCLNSIASNSKLLRTEALRTKRCDWKSFLEEDLIVNLVCDRNIHLSFSVLVWSFELHQRYRKYLKTNAPSPTIKWVNNPVPPWHSSGTHWYCWCCRKTPTLICQVKGTWTENLLTEETQSTSYSKKAFLAPCSSAQTILQL